MQSKPTQANRDEFKGSLIWSSAIDGGGFLIWNGTAAPWWWEQVARSDAFQRQRDKATGHWWRLNPHTDTITFEGPG